MPQYCMWFSGSLAATSRTSCAFSFQQRIKASILNCTCLSMVHHGHIWCSFVKSTMITSIVKSGYIIFVGFHAHNDHNRHLRDCLRDCGRITYKECSPHMVVLFTTMHSLNIFSLYLISKMFILTCYYKNLYFVNNEHISFCIFVLVLQHIFMYGDLYIVKSEDW